MCPDTYASFSQLSARKREGHDYLITISRRDSPIAVIAPHGGGIEPGISEITKLDFVHCWLDQGP